MGCCFDKPDSNKKKSDHKDRKKRKFEPKSLDRLKSEFKLIRDISKNNQIGNYNESMTLALEYYVDK